MDFKNFYYDLFFDINKSVTRMYTAKQGDTKARGFYVTILQDSVVMPVTTQTMTFYAEKPDKTRIFVDAVKDGDKFRVDLTNQVFAVPGKVRCELTLRGATGEQISSKTFAMLVDASIQDGSIVSADERGVLDRAFELAVDIIPRLELLDVELLENVNSEVILARGTEPTLGARLDGTDAQLAEIEQDKAEKTDIGLLSGLLTTAKTSIVNAINELFNSKANKAQEVWIKPTLVNGWVETDPVSYPIGYYKDDFGRVWMRGRIQGGISGTVMFTVGTTYRPMAYANPLMSDNDGNAKGARVSTVGQVTAFYSSAVLPLRLDSVNYRAGV